MYGFLFFRLQTSLIKIETSFLALHYFEKNFLPTISFYCDHYFYFTRKDKKENFQGARLARTDESLYAKGTNILEFPLSLFMDFNYHPTHL